MTDILPGESEGIYRISLTGPMDEEWNAEVYADNSLDALGKALTEREMMFEYVYGEGWKKK